MTGLTVTVIVTLWIRVADTDVESVAVPFMVTVNEVRVATDGAVNVTVELTF